MVGQSLWKNLKTLVDIDKKLNDAISKIEKAQNLLKNDHVTILKFESEIKKSENLSFEQKKNLDLIELEATDIKNKENHIKEKLENIKNPKEYKALEKELKAIQLQSLEIENNLVKSWHQLEAEKEKLALSKKDLINKTTQLKEGIISQEKGIVDLENEKVKFQEERNLAIKNIPLEWLNKYERMKDNVPDPIVPVVGSACSACYYLILRQDISKLKQSGVLLCRNCYRFLYYDAEEEKDIQKESY